MAVEHAAGLPQDHDAVDVIIAIYERLKQYGIEHYTIEDDWQRLIRTQIGKLDMRREVDANILIRYHCLLWKTSKGWTYQRTPAEMKVDSAYNPTTLAVFGDQTESTIQLVPTSRKKPAAWRRVENGVHGICSR